LLLDASTFKNVTDASEITANRQAFMLYLYSKADGCFFYQLNFIPYAETEAQ